MLIKFCLLLAALTFLLVACLPTATNQQTAEPAAVITVARATAATTPSPPPPTLTPTPTTTPLPISPTPWDVPSVTPSPTPPAVLDDIWVSGYIMGERLPDCPFQVGQMDQRPTAEPIGCLTLVPVDEAVAAQLTAVPPGDTLLKLTGDLDTRGAKPLTFTVTSLTYVNLPYSPQTPLVATYNDNNLGISVAYPQGWTVHDEDDAVTITSMPPDAVSLRPGREHLDPTEFFFTLRAADADTLAQWRAEYEALAGPAPTLSQIQVGDHNVIRAEWTVYGVVIEYGVEINGRVLIFRSNDIGEAFMARVVATLRPLVYENVMTCGYRMSADRFQVGSISKGGIRTFSLTPADEEVAAQLATIPFGDTFLQLHGDLIAAGNHEGELVVDSVGRVTLPYTTETPLTAVYTHTQPAFTFLYPDGWVLSRDDTSQGTELFLSNTPEIPGCHRPGRIHGDPTAVAITIKITNFGNIAEFINYYQNQTQSECDGPVLQSQEAVMLSGWEMTKAVLESCPFGPREVYALELENQVVTWQTYQGNREVMPRLLTTLTAP